MLAKWRGGKCGISRLLSEVKTSGRFFQIFVAFSDNPNNNNYYLFYLTHFGPIVQKLGKNIVGFGTIEDTYIPFRDFMTFN